MCLLCCSSWCHRAVRTPRIYQNNQEQHLKGIVAENAVRELWEGRGGGSGTPPALPGALSSCTGFCDAASVTERAGGAGQQHQTSHPPQRHFNMCCLQAQRPQHPLTSTEALLSLRLSSANNLGVKVLQENFSILRWKALSSAIMGIIALSRSGDPEAVPRSKNSMC